MANIFKNSVSTDIGTSPVDVYVAGSGVTTTAIGMSLANTTAGTINVDVQLVDTSTATTAHLVKAIEIPANTAVVIIGGDQKVVLEQTDKLTVTSDTATSVDAIVSVLEQS